MADYLSFVGGIVLLNTESSDFDKELNVKDLSLEEEYVIQFNHPGEVTEILASAPA